MTEGLPPFFTLEDLESLARTKLPRMVHDYYAGGAEEEYSVKENRQAFARYRILPRILVDVSKLNSSFNFLGYNASFPVFVAPMAMQRMAHPEGEIATAKGAMAAGVPMIFSTMATTGLEPLAQTDHPCLIYQLYVIKNRAVVKSWVEDAERLGYKAVMITVDAQRLGRRERDERNKFRLPERLQLENLKRLRVTERTQARDDTDGSGLMALFASEVDDALTWEFLPWLRSITRLPIFIKGLLSAEDAVLALRYGVDGIVVSNHGGRQLDYSPSALDCLPAVVAAVGGRVPVFMDGGIRRGTDILKALALGAQAVLVGRPILYGLAMEGSTGVCKVLSTLKAEFETAMALAGCPSLRHITPDLVLPPGALAPLARTTHNPAGLGQGSQTLVNPHQGSHTLANPNQGSQTAANPNACPAGGCCSKSSIQPQRCSASLGHPTPTRVNAAAAVSCDPSCDHVGTTSAPIRRHPPHGNSVGEASVLAVSTACKAQGQNGNAGGSSSPICSNQIRLAACRGESNTVAPIAGIVQDRQVFELGRCSCCGSEDCPGIERASGCSRSAARIDGGVALNGTAGRLVGVVGRRVGSAALVGRGLLSPMGSRL